MDRKIEDIRIMPKDFLCTVAMVNIPIDNHNFANSQLGPRVRGRHGDVVNDTIPSGNTGLGVVARRTNNGKPIVQFSLHDIRYECTKFSGRLLGF